MTSSSDPSRAIWLSRVAFGLAISIVVARALMVESVRDVGTDPTYAPAGPGATTALVLDWLSGLPAMLVLIRRLLDRSFRLRWSWSHSFLVALGLWALISVAWADDQFLTLVSAPRLLAGAILFWAFAQLVRRWDQLRIVAGVLVGLLLANVAHAVIFRTLDYPDLEAYWKTNKAQVLAEHNWQEGDYSAVRFEKKLLAGEVLGFNVSPNALGAIVIMMSLTAVGCAAQRIQDRDEPGWAGVIVIAAGSSLYALAYTGSKASNAAGVLGLIALGVWRVSRRWLATHRALMFSAGIAAVLLGVVTVIALGLTRGGLPEDSLNFRWRYSVGAWKLLLINPLRGVGWANFADHYLATRLPQATEEINDPHNLFVKLAVELGFVGLTLGVAWMILWAWHVSQLAAAMATPSATPDAATKHTLEPSPFPAAGLLAAAAFAFVLTAVCAIDFTTTGGGAFILLELMKRGLFVGLVAIGVGIVGIRSSSEPFIDARPAPWIAAALFIGVALVVLQSAVDITFFQTGPFMLAIMAMGALAGVARTDRPARRDSLCLIGLIVGLLFGLVMLIVIVVPVGIAEHKAAMARMDSSQKRYDLAGREFGQAFGSWSLVKNVDYALDAGQAYATLAVESAGDRRAANAAEASGWFDRAVEADPHSPQALLTRARWRARTATDAAAIDAALADYDTSVRLNPNDVELRIEYADALERFGHRAQAADQLSEALAINDRFDPKEPERIELQSPTRLDELRSRLARLQAEK